MSSDHREPRPPLENLRSGTWQPETRVAEDLVGEGRCASYDEAYAVLRSLRSGEMVQTRRGYLRKQ